jgi:hypothetical protein
MIAGDKEHDIMPIKRYFIITAVKVSGKAMHREAMKRDMNMPFSA